MAPQEEYFWNWFPKNNSIQRHILKKTEELISFDDDDNFVDDNL